MGDLLRMPALRLLGIDAARGTRIRAAYGELSRSQWHARAELRNLQMDRLTRIVHHAVGSIPFYRKWCADRGLKVGELRLPDDLSLFPVITKAAIKENPALFLPDDGVSTRRYPRRTGGSTGDPFSFFLGREALSWQWGGLFRIWEGTGYRLGDKTVTIGGGSVAAGTRISFQHRVYDWLKRNRSLTASRLDGAGISNIVAGLRNQSPRMIYGYPSLLYQVAVGILDSGQPLTGVASVVTTSEMLFPGQRRALEEAFACPVFDQYGCNEVNLLSGECAQHDGLHMSMEQCFVEILDEQDQPVPPGQIGRIVGTNLLNRAMGFIRYDTGDLGSLTEEPCACGRGLDRIMNLAGRSRDMIRGAGNRLVHGVAFNRVMMRYTWVARYQILQEDPHRITLNIDHGESIPAGALDALSGEIHTLCGLEVVVTCKQPFVMTGARKAPVIINRLENPGVS